MKQFLFLITIVITFPAFAQLSEVKKKLKEYHFSEDLLVANMKDSDAEHFFDAKITTINSTETKVEKARFDPTKIIGERWILLSVNDNEPSKKELKNFDKSHNTKQQDINGEIDDDFWGIAKENDDYLIIKFKYKKSTLPKKYDFLGDCTGMAYFNKKTKRLEKADFVNDSPLKIKIFNVTKMNLVVSYEYSDEDNIYLIQKEDMEMEAKLLGQTVVVKEIYEFSNYKNK